MCSRYGPSKCLSIMHNVLFTPYLNFVPRYHLQCINMTEDDAGDMGVLYIAALIDFPYSPTLCSLLALYVCPACETKTGLRTVSKCFCSAFVALGLCSTLRNGDLFFLHTFSLVGGITRLLISVSPEACHESMVMYAAADSPPYRIGGLRRGSHEPLRL